MALKNLMVHLDQGERTAARLELAVSLARRHQARLVGVFGQRGLPQVMWNSLRSLRILSVTSLAVNVGEVKMN